MLRHAFVIGGTGQIGRAVAAELLDSGWHVTLSCRGTRPRADDLIARGAVIATIDREEPGALKKVLATGADAVVDTIAFTEGHADQLLEIEGSIGTFVVISSAGVYRDDAGRTLGDAGRTGFPEFPNPIKESQSTVEPGPEAYSTRKVALERRLLDQATTPVTILRPCAIHGPYSIDPREWWFVKRMLDGRRLIPLAYRGQSRFHTSAVANIAALIGTALDNPGTRILNVADPRALSVAEIGASISRHLGYEGTILPVNVGDEKGNAAVGSTPWSVPALFTLDTTAATALGYTPATTYEDAVARTCDWLVAQSGKDWKTQFPGLAKYPGELFDYATEDSFLTSAGY
jgi:nucleoside-diphosphate-sugar epimerase